MEANVAMEPGECSVIVEFGDNSGSGLNNMRIRWRRWEQVRWHFTAARSRATKTSTHGLGGPLRAVLAHVLFG
jgi:hypothetical protein